MLEPRTFYGLGDRIFFTAGEVDYKGDRVLVVIMLSRWLSAKPGDVLTLTAATAAGWASSPSLHQLDPDAAIVAAAKDALAVLHSNPVVTLCCGERDIEEAGRSLYEAIADFLDERPTPGAFYRTAQRFYFLSHHTEARLPYSNQAIRYYPAVVVRDLDQVYTPGETLALDVGDVRRFVPVEPPAQDVIERVLDQVEHAQGHVVSNDDLDGARAGLRRFLKPTTKMIGKPEPLIIEVRGRRFPIETRLPGVSPALSAMALALFALEDPRVDAVLKAAGFRLTDVDGQTLFDD